MSTRSSITVKLPNGKYVGIYCHFDGYVEGPHGVGYKLVKYYNSQRRASNLVKLGHISILGRFIKTKKPHDYENQRKGITVAYHRDRGEDYSRAEGDSWSEVVQTIAGAYAYLFEDGQWFVSRRYGNTPPVPVADLLQE